MEWMRTAEIAHGEVLDALTMDVARRYGEETALLAEDEASWCMGRMAEDMARDDALAFGIVPLVTPRHVALAAASYRYRPSFPRRLVASVARIARSLGMAARTA